MQSVISVKICGRFFPQNVYRSANCITRPALVSFRGVWWRWSGRIPGSGCSIQGTDHGLDQDPRWLDHQSAACWWRWKFPNGTEWRCRFCSNRKNWV